MICISYHCYYSWYYYIQYIYIIYIYHHLEINCGLAALLAVAMNPLHI